MKQHGGEEGHLGILLRGANGSLWFMRDDADGPERLKDELAKRIDKLLGPPMQADELITYPVSHSVIEALETAYGPISPTGVIHGCATKPPRG